MTFETGHKLYAGLDGGERERWNDRQKPITAAIRRALIQDDKQRVRQGVEALLDLAATGDLPALMFIRDTIQGRPSQAVEVTQEVSHTLTAIHMVVVEHTQGVELGATIEQGVTKAVDVTPTPLAPPPLDCTPAPGVNRVPPLSTQADILSVNLSDDQNPPEAEYKPVLEAVSPQAERVSPLIPATDPRIEAARAKIQAKYERFQKFPSIAKRKKGSSKVVKVD